MKRRSKEDIRYHKDHLQGTKREKLKLLYIFYFFLLFLFLLLYSIFVRIKVVDLTCNIELGSLKNKFHLCLNIKETRNIYGKPFSLVSINLFNQLVIVICDPVMEG